MSSWRWLTTPGSRVIYGVEEYAGTAVGTRTRLPIPRASPACPLERSPAGRDLLARRVHVLATTHEGAGCPENSSGEHIQHQRVTWIRLTASHDLFDVPMNRAGHVFRRLAHHGPFAERKLHCAGRLAIAGEHQVGANADRYPAKHELRRVDSARPDLEPVEVQFVEAIQEGGERLDRPLRPLFLEVGLGHAGLEPLDTARDDAIVGAPVLIELADHLMGVVVVRD